MDLELPSSINLFDVLEHLPSGIVLTDAAGRIIFVNRAFTGITGYTLEDCKGSTPRILKSGRHSDEEYEALWKAILAGREFRGRFINKKKDGSLYWEYIQISVLRDGSGERWFLAVVEDITAMQEGGDPEQPLAGEKADESEPARARLERLVLTEKRMLSQIEKLLLSERNVNTMRADLISVLSHEFRTPLSIIQSSADILKSYRSQMDTDTIDRRLDKIASMVFLLRLFWTMPWESGRPDRTPGPARTSRP